MSSEAKMPNEVWVIPHSYVDAYGNYTAYDRALHGGDVRYIRADLSALEAERGDVDDLERVLYRVFSKRNAGEIYAYCLKVLTGELPMPSVLTQPHPPAVAGAEAFAVMPDANDTPEAFKDWVRSNWQAIEAALTPPANADLMAVRNAVARMIEACEADTHPNDWRTAGDGTPLGDLRQALATLDRMMKGRV